MFIRLYSCVNTSSQIVEHESLQSPDVTNQNNVLLLLGRCDHNHM